MPTKKDPRAPKDKERFEVLLEDIQDKVQLLAEGQKMQGDRLEAKIEEGFKEQNRQRELGQRALTKRIDGVEASLTKEIREVKADIRENILPRLEDHEQRITALEEKPAA